MTLPAPEVLYEVEERVLSGVDVSAGIARRWAVTHVLSGIMRLVVLTTRSPGRWSAEPRYLCSEHGDLSCAHIEAVRDTLEHPPRAA